MSLLPLIGNKNAEKYRQKIIIITNILRYISKYKKKKKKKSYKINWEFIHLKKKKKKNI
jgi:hypothetical protein